MFGTILISVCTIMHIYVFLRIASVPYVNRYVSRKVFIGTGFILWLILLGGRLIGRRGVGFLAETLEFFGMTYMAVLFLTFVILLVADLVTGFGFFMPRLSQKLRGWGLVLGLLLSIIALVQGMRPPVIQEYEVIVPGLPEAVDGTILVALSDLHISSHTGERWLETRVARVLKLKPDIVVLLGDIIEGSNPPPDNLIKSLSRLTAPLKVWAVNGNHETYGGGKTKFLEQTGFNVLKNRWAEILPGFVIAGVDDLSINRRRGGDGETVSKALSGRPSGATVFLSHSPLFADKAAMAGAELMLSGHTHGGQIWPFNYLVRLRYPLVEGRYDVDGMTVIVSRGTGTWGPRMRLWSPGEILRVTLRSK